MEEPPSRLQSIDALMAEQFQIDVDSLPGGSYRLQFRNDFNRKGIIYNLTAVLYVHGWDIISALARTEGNTAIEDSFTIRPMQGQAFDDKMMATMKVEVAELLSAQLSVAEYLERYPENVAALYREVENDQDSIIKLSIDHKSDLNFLELEARDRPGLLMLVCQVFDLLYLDIISFEAHSQGDRIFDTFYFHREDGSAIDQRGLEWMEYMIKKLL